MADLPIVTTKEDLPQHAFHVSVTLTGNEWVLIAAALEGLASQPGIDEYGPRLKVLARYIDDEVVSQGHEQRMEAHRGDIRG